MGIIHQDFVIQNSYFNSLYDFYFPKRKTSLIIVTNTALHFNDHGLSRPDECPLLADFTQRRQISHKDGLLQGHKPRERQQTNKSKYSFSKHKNPKKKTLRPYEFVERRIILLRFSHKEQTSDKVYRLSDKQPALITLSELPRERTEKGIPEVFSDGVNPKIKFSPNKGNFHVIKAISHDHTFFLRHFRLAQIAKTQKKIIFTGIHIINE